MKRMMGIALLVAALFISTIADSQIIWRPNRRGGGYRPGHQQPMRPRLPEFKPSFTITAGYGFPNLDKMYLPGYYDIYYGNIRQTGPISISADYRFSRRTSLGITVTHGTVEAPYYDYSSSGIPVFTAKFDNWSYMVNFMRYIPVPGKVEPYFRTSVGINTWTQEYTDVNGNKAPVDPVYLPDFAYQVGVGARFNVAKHLGFTLEGGYGKYIVHGGLSLKF